MTDDELRRAADAAMLPIVTSLAPAGVIGAHWLPDRAVEVPPEPGIANLRRLLAPEPGDTAAPGQLQQLVRAVAEDRAPDRAYGRGRLAAYLAAPPRLLDLAEADAVITELEALSPKDTP